MMSDEALISELRKYGESHIKITDKNRDIYIKKLNHHRAQQKVKENPSKQYLKHNRTLNTTNNTTSTSNKSSIKYHLITDNNNYEDDEEDAEEEEETEYVQVSNAFTSPMSKSVNHHRSTAKTTKTPKYEMVDCSDEDDCQIIGERQPAPKTPTQQHSNPYHSRQILEVEKTLEKYRSDIHSILDQSKVRARHHNNSSLLNNTASEIVAQAKLGDDRTLIKKESSNWKMTIARVLPYLVFALLLVIALQYIRIKMRENGFEFLVTHVAPVEESFCADIHDAKCAQTRNLALEVIGALRTRAGDVECKMLFGDGDISESEKRMSVQHVIELLKSRGLIKSAETHVVHLAISALITAVSDHPKWEVTLLDRNGAVLDSDLVKSSNGSLVAFFVSNVALKNFKCRTMELLRDISIKIALAIAAIALLWLTFGGLRWWYKSREEKKKTFYELVSQVVETVRSQYEANLRDSSIDSYVAINHMFDSLVTPSQRQAQKALWSQVVKFISEQESRIRVEMKLLNGEETLVWQWIVPKQLIPPNSPLHSITLSNKPTYNSIFPNLDPFKEQPAPRIDLPPMTQDYATCARAQSSQTQSYDASMNGSAWQGDAVRKTPEKLMVSPTPCLKIRNMFDQQTVLNDVNFMKQIQTDILRKCASVNSIVHISCDKKSKEGCVYVKCDNNAAAGKVYQLLNGTWYNGNLLGVKFLRNDRYLERFPESKDFTRPLRA